MCPLLMCFSSREKSGASMELCFKVDLTLLGKDSKFSQRKLHSENLFVHVTISINSLIPEKKIGIIYSVHL